MFFFANEVHSNIESILPSSTPNVLHMDECINDIMFVFFLVAVKASTEAFKEEIYHSKSKSFRGFDRIVYRKHLVLDSN